MSVDGQTVEWSPLTKREQLPAEKIGNNNGSSLSHKFSYRTVSGTMGGLEAAMQIRRAVMDGYVR